MPDPFFYMLNCFNFSTLLKKLVARANSEWNQIIQWLKDAYSLKYNSVAKLFEAWSSYKKTIKKLPGKRLLVREFFNVL